MSYSEDIANFNNWALNLGCPPNFLPGEDALKSIFKSPQRDSFLSMLKRLQPRNKVQQIRENILIKNVSEFKDKVIPACDRSFWPKELQRYHKMNDLRKKQLSSEIALKEVKKEFTALSVSIKKKNVQTIEANHRKEQEESKYNILKLKHEALCANIKKEEEIKSQLLANMPVKLNAKNTNETAAMQAVQQAIKELEQFYQIFYNNNNNTQIIQDVKQKLWTKLRTVLADLTNFSLFNVLMKLKETQLQHTMQLNTTVIKSVENQSHASRKANLNNFEIKVLKTKGELLGLVARYLRACNEVVVLEERFANLYVTFVDELEKKVFSFNGITEENATDGEGDIISNFLVQFNMRSFNRARNDYLQSKVVYYRNEIELNGELLENHEVLLGSLKQAYADINTTINRMQYEMSQLNQIKDKILYTKNLLQNMFHDMQTASQQQQQQQQQQTKNAKPNYLNSQMKSSNLSISFMGVESFEMHHDSVFCSTKVDFDANTTMIGGGNLTLMPGISNGTGGLPSHLLELNTFADTNLNKLSCITYSSSYYLLPSPLIRESGELASTVQLTPGLLLTPFGSIQEVKKRIIWATTIAALDTKRVHKFSLDEDLMNVEEQDLLQKSKEQDEKLSQCLDSHDFMTMNTKHSLQKVERVYKFILTNPMRRYIPDTKLFQNKCYADYESQFMLFYRMVINGPTMSK